MLQPINPPLHSFETVPPPEHQACPECQRFDNPGLSWLKAVWVKHLAPECQTVMHQKCAAKAFEESGSCLSCKSEASPEGLESLRARVGRAVSDGVEGKMIAGFLIAGVLMGVTCYSQDHLLNLGTVSKTFGAVMERVFIGAAVIQGAGCRAALSDPKVFRKTIPSIAFGGVVGACSSMGWIAPTDALAYVAGSIASLSLTFFISKKSNHSEKTLFSSVLLIAASGGAAALIHAKDSKRAGEVFCISIGVPGVLSVFAGIPIYKLTEYAGYFIGFDAPDLRTPAEKAEEEANRPEGYTSDDELPLGFGQV